MARAMREPDDRLPSLFQPNTILPVQYFNQLHRRSAWTGELRLMAAILQDAVEVVYTRPKTSRKARQLIRETTRWFRSNDRTHVFSFLRICEALGLHPNAVRSHIGVWDGIASAPAPKHRRDATAVADAPARRPERIAAAG